MSDPGQSCLAILELIAKLRQGNPFPVRFPADMPPESVDHIVAAFAAYCRTTTGAELTVESQPSNDPNVIELLIVPK